MTASLSEHLHAAHQLVAQHTPLTPRIGLILGSGLGAIAQHMREAVTLPYHTIPGMPAPTVAGHRGELLVGQFGDVPVAILSGRPHFYEGYSMQEVVYPVRLLYTLGCDTLIVTNAAGGLVPAWQVGDIMCITNHIFLPGLAGWHPLRGPNDDALGPRFPPLKYPYAAELITVACTAAAQHGYTLREGVYVMVAGPHFETAAELRMLQTIGADAVGMSTVPEVVAANHAGMRVLGFSIITNLALPDSKPDTHDDVLAAGAATSQRMVALLTSVIAAVAATPAPSPPSDT